MTQVQIFMPGDSTDEWDPSRPAWFVAAQPQRQTRRTAAADRTASARRRAGSRRVRRLANRPGPSPRPAPPWTGWQDLGWIDETEGGA